MNPVDQVFMALCIWREARGEQFRAKAGVAWTIMNDILSVITHPWQFSSMTAHDDPNLAHWPRSMEPAWQESLQVAKEVLTCQLEDPTSGAVYYHDSSLSGPPVQWGSVELKATIGRLLFYV